MSNRNVPKNDLKRCDCFNYFLFEEKRCIKSENTSKAKKSKYWVKF